MVVEEATLALVLVLLQDAAPAYQRTVSVDPGTVGSGGVGLPEDEMGVRVAPEALRGLEEDNTRVGPIGIGVVPDGTLEVVLDLSHGLELCFTFPGVETRRRGGGG